MTPPAVNLAAALYLANRNSDDIKNRVESLLTTLFPAWQRWSFHPPDQIEVWQATDSERSAAVLHARGFATVTLHGHRAERFLTCTCVPREKR